MDIYPPLYIFGWYILFSAVLFAILGWVLIEKAFKQKRLVLKILGAVVFAILGAFICIVLPIIPFLTSGWELGGWLLLLAIGAVIL